jgi:spore coat protein CotH
MRIFLRAAFGLFLFCIASVQAQVLYDLNTVQKIEIYFSQPNWDYQMDTAKAGADGYIMADSVFVNGTFYDSVGVKYKGNVSYNASYAKNPLHIELDQFKSQAYEGFKDIKLGNNNADPSMIREVLAYYILGNYMHSPRSNFAQVYINGVYIGVYANEESINKQFCSDHFYSSSGTFIKCNPIVNPGPTTKANLKYITSDSSSYFNFYELKSDYGWNDLVNLCDTVTNHSSALSEIMDVDRAIWMLAFNNVLVNLDSYEGAYCQNYYLYKDKTNHFNTIIWDLNMCFGGFPFVGNGATGIGQMTVSTMQQMPLTIHTNAADTAYWPLIRDIVNNSFYKKMYVAHMRTIVNEFFANNNYETLASQLQTIVDTAVLSDTNKFFTYSEFQAGMTGNVTVGSNVVPGISNLMDPRVTYLQSTVDFAYTTPTITSVLPDNSAPAYNSLVTINATIINSTAVYLGYRFSKENKFIRIPMYDDGTHNDGVAGDNIYGASFILNAVTAQYYVYAENANAGMFSPERAEHEFYTLNADIPSPNAGDVVINEFLADNLTSILSDYSEYADWIELYNNTSSSLNLLGLYLSDDLMNQTKYQFPDTAVIQPNSYLIIWADENNITSSYLHCNFKLSTAGEQLILSNSFGTILDSLSYGPQTTDITYGRCPDGTGAFTALTSPSFGATNCVVGIDEIGNSASAFIYPNPASGQFVLITKNIFSHSIKVDIDNLLGQCVYSRTFPADGSIIISPALSDGIYIVKVNGIACSKLQIFK